MFYIENITSIDLSCIIDAGITDGPSSGKHSEETRTSTPGNVCAAMGDSHTTEAIKSQRARIQAPSTTDIQIFLKHSMLSIQEVTTCFAESVDSAKAHTTAS
jgi:hypothetical protein